MTPTRRKGTLRRGTAVEGRGARGEGGAAICGDEGTDEDADLGIAGEKPIFSDDCSATGAIGSGGCFTANGNLGREGVESSGAGSTSNVLPTGSASLRLCVSALNSGFFVS